MTFVDSHGYAHKKVDVFISGSHKNHRIKTIGRKLQQSGFSIFHSGFGIPAGEDYHRYIRYYVEHSDVILVCWCKDSTESTYVNAEAEFGRVNNRLVACKTDACELKPPFNTFQTVDLSTWDGDDSDGGWKALLDLLKHRKEGKVQPFVQSISAQPALKTRSSWLFRMFGR